MDARVAVLVRLMVEVEMPLVVSSAATKEAPAAKTVKRMFEMCILTRCVVICVVRRRGLIRLIQQCLSSVSFLFWRVDRSHVDGSSFGCSIYLVNVVRSATLREAS